MADAKLSPTLPPESARYSTDRDWLRRLLEHDGWVHTGSIGNPMVDALVFRQGEKLCYIRTLSAKEGGGYHIEPGP